MNQLLNWNKIRSELNKITDVEKLKTELNKIGTEFKNFDLQQRLSPSAHKRLQELEKKYSKVIRGMSQAQRQFDREFNKVIRTIKLQKNVAKNKIQLVRRAAELQKKKLEAASLKLQKQIKIKINPKTVKRKKTTKKKTKSGGHKTTKKTAST